MVWHVKFDPAFRDRSIREIILQKSRFFTKILKFYFNVKILLIYFIVKILFFKHFKTFLFYFDGPSHCNFSGFSTTLTLILFGVHSLPPKDDNCFVCLFTFLEGANFTTSKNPENPRKFIFSHFLIVPKIKIQNVLLPIVSLLGNIPHIFNLFPDIFSSKFVHFTRKSSLWRGGGKQWVRNNG